MTRRHRRSSGGFMLSLLAVKTAHAVWDNRVAIAKIQKWPIDRKMFSMTELRTVTEEQMQEAVHERIEAILKARPNSLFWRNYCRGLYIRAHVNADRVILARGGTPVGPHLDWKAWGHSWRWWFQPIRQAGPAPRPACPQRDWL